MIDLKQLKAFSTLAEFGSFSRSAGVLGVAQPVLSRQIKALEQELGVELFYRNGRGTVLTEAGKVLNLYAKDLVDTVDRAASEVMALKSSPRGTIVIGLPPSVGIVLTVPLVQHFRAAFPLISLRVIEGFSGHVLEWLLTGKIDVAVLYNAPRTGSLRAEPLLTDELFLLGPAEGGILPDAESVPARLLSEIPLILPARPHGLRMLIDSMLGAAGIVPRVEIEVEAMPSTLGLVGERGRLHHPVLLDRPCPRAGRADARLADRRARHHPPAHPRDLEPAPDHPGDALARRHGAPGGPQPDRAGALAAQGALRKTAAIDMTDIRPLAMPPAARFR